ncbi:MAG: signal peptidase I [Candidatus Coprovivens sp.]
MPKNKKVVKKNKKNNWLEELKKITPKKEKPKKEIDIKSLTSKEIEEELKRETYKSKYIKVLKSTIYALVIIAAIATLLATFFMPVFQISGSSMAPKYNNGEFVISIKTTNLKRKDVIAFYHGNKILVKRVIASPGEWVAIDEEGNVYVDGLQLEESYVSNKVIGEYDIEFPYQVPDGHYFVLSDDRTESTDSRNSEIGSISEDDIIGKIVFRVWPFNNFGFTE